MSILRKVKSDAGNKFLRINEKEVNSIACAFLAKVFLIFPVMLLLDIAGIFKFSTNAVIYITVAGSFCTISPYLVSRFVTSEKIVKYYTIICTILITSLLATEYYVGIYMSFLVAPIISCMYFDKKFTRKTILLAYAGYLISYYFRTCAAVKIIYIGDKVLDIYIPLALGFTIEFVVAYVFLYRLVERTQEFLIKQRDLIEEIEKEKAKLQLLMTASSDIIFEYDIAENKYISNGSVENWEKKDWTLDDFLAILDDKKWKTEDFRDVLYRAMNLSKDEGEYLSGEVDMSFEKEGRTYLNWGYYDMIIIRDDSDKPVTILGKLRNITEKKLNEIKVQETKKYDALTGMYHYASLRKIIADSEIVDEENTHQIMIIYIKNYIQIGQCYGEVYRDFIIMNVAEIIKSVVGGTSALPCRLSDDVFLIYIDDSEGANARELRQRINDSLRKMYIGNKKVNKLLYDFGYYLGQEKMDEFFNVAFNYIHEGWTEKDILESTPVNNIIAVSSKENLKDIPESMQSEKAKAFAENFSSLVMDSKDQESTIQIALSHIGRFFGLDGIRVYPIYKSNQSVNAMYQWGRTKHIMEECDMFSLNKEVKNFFVDNFGRSRIVDNTVGAFKDFFRQFSENPFLLTNYSSLIYPIVSEDTCKAVLLFDMNETDYSFSDEWKEYLLSISNIFGRNILRILEKKDAVERNSLLSQMSREIRMPMNMIFEITEIARMDIDKKEHIERCLDIIDVSSKDMLHVVNNILDLSKIELAAWQSTNEVFSLEDILSSIEENMIKRIERNGINLKVERQFQENLLRGDSSKIVTIMNYLLENSVRYTDQNGEIQVLIQEENKTEHVVDLFFMVEDNGIAISDEELRQFEELLETGNNWCLNDESRIGLDIVITYRFIEVLGGKLRIESNKEKGNRFIFSLSFDVPSKESMLEFISNKKEKNRNNIDMTGRRVLLAEDDAMNAEIVKRLFEKRGATVEIASNGKQCIEMFMNSRENYYSIILMDIVMPIIDGRQASREIRSMDNREDSKEVPIIALSATAFEKDKKQSLEAGMNAHLVKPIHLEEVLREIKKYL